MSETSKAAKDWQWWVTSPYADESTVRECIHEAQAYITELEATIERLTTQMDLVRQSFNLQFPGAGDPFLLRENYDRMAVEKDELKATIERLTWMLNRCAAFLWDAVDSPTEEACIAEVLADLERRWEERDV